MNDALVIASLVFFVYFAVYNLLTITLLAMSYGEIAWLVRGRQPRRSGLRPLSHRPGISVLVPAFNEQEVVVTTVSALMQQDYAPLEVVVVDDGSTHATFERLDAAFDLVSIPIGTGLPLQTAAIESLPVARRAPGLRVVRKANGGRADALNAGLGIARHELVAVTDADSLLEPDALIRALRPFEEQPDGCLAVGGSIRVANQSRISNGRVQVARIGGGIEAGVRARLPRHPHRVVAAERSAHRQRSLRAVPTRDAHRHRRILAHHDGRGHGADGAPAPPATTGLARGERALRRGRNLLDAGTERPVGPALLALPYLAFFEAIAPLVELTGWTLATVLLIVDPSAWPWAAAMLLITVLFGQVQTMLALLVQETAFHGYSRRDLTRMLGWGLLECLWYHPLLAIWRTSGTIRLAVGRRPGWGEIPREALEEAPTAALTPLTR